MALPKLWVHVNPPVVPGGPLCEQEPLRRRHPRLLAGCHAPGASQPHLCDCSAHAVQRAACAVKGNCVPKAQVPKPGAGCGMERATDTATANL